MVDVDWLDPGRIYPRRAVYLDYLSSTAKLSDAYRYFPPSKDALLARAQELLGKHDRRDCLSAALVRYNRSLAAGSRTMANARLLAEPETLAVVTGQQAGFAGGPLYSIYKAVTAIKIAQWLSRSIQKPVVPIFWIASEDCNVREIDHADWVDRQGQLRRISAGLPGETRQISSLCVDQNTCAAFEELMQLLPQSEFRDHWQKVYKPRIGDRWAQWFGRVYAQLFGEHGLVLVEPHIAYSCGSEVFGRVVSQLASKGDVANVLRKTFEAGTARLTELGYSPQVTTNYRTMLYLTDEGLRRPIVAQGQELLVEPSDSYSVSELTAMAKKQPERFSCAVMLRPIVQDSVLPTVAYVAGPGEVAYYGQLRGLYEQLEVAMPVVWPRASMTLVEPKIARLMKKGNTNLAEVFSDRKAAESAPLTQSQSAVTEQLQRLAQQAKVNIDELAKIAKEQSPSLDKFVSKASSRIDRDLERLLKRTLESITERSDAINRQHERVRMNLRPENRPQERVFPLLPYLIYYGQAVLDDIFEQMDVFDFRHRIVRQKSTNNRGDINTG